MHAPRRSATLSCSLRFSVYSGPRLRSPALRNSAAVAQSRSVTSDENRRENDHLTARRLCAYTRKWECRERCRTQTTSSTGAVVVMTMTIRFRRFRGRWRFWVGLDCAAFLFNFLLLIIFFCIDWGWYRLESGFFVCKGFRGEAKQAEKLAVGSQPRKCRRLARCGI